MAVIYVNARVMRGIIKLQEKIFSENHIMLSPGEAIESLLGEHKFIDYEAELNYEEKQILNAKQVPDEKNE